MKLRCDHDGCCNRNLSRFDYQPLFGKGARDGEGRPDTRERLKSSLQFKQLYMYISLDT